MAKPGCCGRGIGGGGRGGLGIGRRKIKRLGVNHRAPGQAAPPPKKDPKFGLVPEKKETSDGA